MHSLRAYVESWNNVARVYDQQHSNRNTKFYASSLKNRSKSRNKKFLEKSFFDSEGAGKTQFFSQPKNRIFTSILRPKSMILTIKLIPNLYRAKVHYPIKHQTVYTKSSQISTQEHKKFQSTEAACMASQRVKRRRKFTWMKIGDPEKEKLWVCWRKILSKASEKFEVLSSGIQFLKVLGRKIACKELEEECGDYLQKLRCAEKG